MARSRLYDFVAAFLATRTVRGIIVNSANVKDAKNSKFVRKEY